MNIEQRYKIFVFDDPLRRCYNGAYGTHHYEWSSWEVLHSNIKPEKADEVLVFWRELNDFAVSQRGESAKREFRAVNQPLTQGEADAQA